MQPRRFASSTLERADSSSAIDAIIVLSESLRAEISFYHNKSIDAIFCKCMSIVTAKSVSMRSKAERAYRYINSPFSPEWPARDRCTRPIGFSTA